MDIQTLIQLADLLKNHAWLPAAIIVITYLTSLTKDWSKFPITIPARWQPVIVLILGQVAGVLTAVTTGVTWKTAILGGIVASFGAMGLYDLIVNAIFNGNPPKWLVFLSLGTPASQAASAAARNVKKSTPPPAQ